MVGKRAKRTGVTHHHGGVEERRERFRSESSLMSNSASRPHPHGSIAALMTRRLLAIVGVASVIHLSSLAVPSAAQWLRYPTAGVPRTRDGKADLAAPAPRTAN